MKKNILILSAFFVAVCLSVCVFSFGAMAADSGNCGADGQNVTWTFDENMGILRIDGEGNTKDYSASGTSAAPWSAFANKITTVSVSENVTGIGEYFFAGCVNLKTVSLPANVTEIKEGVFYGCSSLEAFDIPSGVTKLGEKAFYGCSSLKALNVSAAIESIGENAFFGCGAIAEIAVDAGNAKYRSEQNCLIEIEDNELVRGAKDGNIPESVKKIGVGAFSGCGFESVIVPETVIYMGQGAFEGCQNLKSVTLPFVGDCRLDKDGLPTVEGKNDGEEETERGLYLNRFGYIFGLTARLPESLKTVIITDTEALGSVAFENCAGLTSIVLPEGLVNIGESAFSGCVGISEIKLPETLKILGEKAFRGCTGITAVTIPDSVEDLGASLFLGCNKLKTLKLGKTVDSIGNGFLEGCSALEELSVADGNSVYYSAANCIIAKSSLVLVAGCKNSVIPENIRVIGTGAFRNCIGLETLKIPSGVTEIGDYAFYSCTGLTSVEIPSSVKTVGAFAFAECVSLAKINLTADVKIGESAFANCTSLKSDSLYISTNDITNGNSGCFGLWIGIAVAVPLAAFGTLFAILLRKKKKNENNG